MENTYRPEDNVSLLEVLVHKYLWLALKFHILKQNYSVLLQSESLAVYPST